MFNSDIQKIVNKGYITLIPRLVLGKPGFIGDKVEDQCALLAITGSMMFPETMYDSVLIAVYKAWDVGLEVLPEDPLRQPWYAKNLLTK